MIILSKQALEISYSFMNLRHDKKAQKKKVWKISIPSICFVNYYILITDSDYFFCKKLGIWIFDCLGAEPVWPNEVPAVLLLKPVVP